MMTITPSSLCLNPLSFHLLSLLYLLWHSISHKKLQQTVLIQITRVIITFKLCNWAVKMTVMEFMSPIPISPWSHTLFLSSCIFPFINIPFKKKRASMFLNICYVYVNLCSTMQSSCSPIQGWQRLSPYKGKFHMIISFYISRYP